MDLEIYSYTPLNETLREIRLIQLDPGERSPLGKINCTLVSVPLDIIESGYYALSYVWGNPELSHKILVNGKVGQVTRNLDAALDDLCMFLNHEANLNQHGQILFWVDSICIDQSNDEEKRWQVQMMTDIFVKAREVVAWLGSETSHSARAMETLRIVGQFALQTRAKKIPLDLFRAYSPADIRHMNELLSREFFHRIWILQEVVVAKRLSFVCGPAFLDGDLATLAISLLFERPMSELQSLQNTLVYLTYSLPYSQDQAIPLGLVQILGTREWYKRGYRRPILDLLEASHICGMQARHPSDRIFALLGLPREAWYFMRPDYSRDWTQVYEDLAVYFLRRNLPGSLRAVLLYAMKGPRHDLRSWVPNWAAPKDDAVHFTEHRLLAAAPSPIFSAAGDNSQVPNFRHMHGMHALVLEGFYLGQVQQTAKSSEDIEDEARRLGTIWLPVWIKNLAGLVTNILNSELVVAHLDTYSVADLAQVLFRTVLADMELGTDSTPRERISRRQYRTYERLLLFGLHYTRNLEQPGFRHFSDFVKQRATRRRPFTNSIRTIGLGPAAMQTGDEVWIIKGIEFPLILRKADDDTHTFIGDAYIHGIMDGEFAALGPESRTVNIV
ncbi:HET-domain-containing protein [Lophiostoma macrostomum CBS 122681]|uniref:HET-domain-containing protein n=1 Tax=Lophiostoma macrostomum CBS 122681 TaxID=1314788 RepID=A0A6A6SXD0_9PLEO|nr:HET-domain-containing protein [Lophiostoma macrostomum CBS 122681]